MVSDNFSASGPMIRDVTSVMGEGNAAGYVPPQGKRWLENKTDAASLQQRFEAA